MDQPKIVTWLPIFLKYGTFLDTRAKQLCNFAVYSRLCLTAILMLYIGSTMTEQLLRDQTLAKTHDFLICFIMFLYEFDYAQNKEKVLGVLEFLLQPFPQYASDDPHKEEIAKYIKEVTRSGKFIIGLSLISVCWSLSPLVLLFFYPGTTVFQTFNMPMSSVCQFESYFANVSVLIISGILLISGVLHFYAWHPIIMYSVLKIRLMVRLLVMDLATLDERMERQAISILNGMVSLPLCSRCRLVHHGNWSAPTMDVERCCRIACKEAILNDCIQQFLCRAVDSHTYIIRMVRLVDKCFCRSVMLYNKVAVFASVVFIPKISLHLQATQYFNSGFEVLGALACIGMFNWCGQLVLNESDELHRALYACQWANKPPRVRKHLVLMMTMATRPLRLTAGSIYTLNMELYFSILSATYSYASLLQSVKD